jgi:hypothetical protein
LPGQFQFDPIEMAKPSSRTVTLVEYIRIWASGWRRKKENLWIS